MRMIAAEFTRKKYSSEKNIEIFSPFCAEKVF